MGSPVLIIFKRSNHHENRDFKRAIFAGEGADGSTVPVVENASPLIGVTIEKSMFIGSTKLAKNTHSQSNGIVLQVACR